MDKILLQSHLNHLHSYTLIDTRTNIPSLSRTHDNKLSQDCISKIYSLRILLNL